MNDNKEKYHVMVLAQKETVMKNGDTKATNAIKAGHDRKERFHANWVKINLNEVIDKFAPGIDPKISDNGKKIVWTNTKTKISVVCDIGGGSLRIQDLSTVGKQHKFKYLDINGKEINNIVLPNGKQRGLTKSEKLALSHYLIMKREEMGK